MTELAIVMRWLFCFIICIHGVAICAQAPNGISLPDSLRKQNGTYRLKTNEVRVKGHVRNHRKYGRWTFKKRDASGKWYVAEERNYWSSVMNGRYFLLDQNRDTVVTGNYHKGEKIGEWRAYSGRQLYQRSYFDAQGYPAGTTKIYYADGNVMAEYIYNDTIHCYTRYYYSDGRISQRGEMTRDKKSGTWYEYKRYSDTLVAADTLPYMISEWKDGELHGITQTYDRGVLLEDQQYYEGSYHGSQHVYKNGVLKSETNYSMGRLHGPQRSYHPSGHVYYESVYSQNELVARHQYDSLTGMIIESAWFTGNRIDSSVTYSRTGRKVYTSVLVDVAGPTHSVMRYYENGMKKDSGTTIGYGYEGEYRSWYENGQLHSIAHYNKHGQCGAFDAWNEKGVHVVHAMTSRYHDTIPEEAWSDHGQKLKRGTKLYDAQLSKYMPYGHIWYNDTVFYLHRVIVSAKMPGPNSSSKGEAVQIEIVDSVGTNKRTAPQLPGGDKAFRNYLSENIWYPAMEREMGIEGSTYISFTVNTDSTLSNFVLLRGVPGGKGLDMEAIRVLKWMPKWSPANKNDKVFRSKCVIEVRWELI